MAKLYQSAKYRGHWIACLEGFGRTMFPAIESGWERRQAARGIDPMHLRQLQSTASALRRPRPASQWVVRNTAKWKAKGCALGTLRLWSTRKVMVEGATTCGQ